MLLHCCFIRRNVSNTFSIYQKHIFLSWQPKKCVIWSCPHLGVKPIYPAYGKTLLYAMFIYLSPSGLHLGEFFLPPKHHKINADRFCSTVKKRTSHEVMGSPLSLNVQTHTDIHRLSFPDSCPRDIVMQQQQPRVWGAARHNPSFP